MEATKEVIKFIDANIGKVSETVESTIRQMYEKSAKMNRDVEEDPNVFEVQSEINKYLGEVKEEFGQENIDVYFKLLQEEKNRSRQRGIYKFYTMLGYTVDNASRRGLDDMLAEMRALPNVTIVTVVVANRRIGENRYIAGLSVKLIPSYPGTFSSPEDVKSRILRDIRRIKGVERIFKVSTSLERVE